MESAALFAFYVHLHSLDHFQCTAARIPKYVCVGIYGWSKVTDREAIWHGSWSHGVTKCGFHCASLVVARGPVRGGGYCVLCGQRSSAVSHAASAESRVDFCLPRTHVWRGPPFGRCPLGTSDEVLIRWFWNDTRPQRFHRLYSLHMDTR